MLLNDKKFVIFKFYAWQSRCGIVEKSKKYAGLEGVCTKLSGIVEL